jgi:AcrR family transcriptional regulator
VSTSAGQAAGGLRERNKAKRRDAILDAALDLLDDPDGPPVTTERIAEVAEVSVATVYNLVGTREQLLVALVDRLIGDLLVKAEGAVALEDPLERIRSLIVASVAALTTRPVAYRRVFRQLAAAANPDLHTRLSPATAMAGELQRAQDAGVIRAGVNIEALALQSYLSYNGALLRWAAGALGDAAFRAAALHGLVVVLAASATNRVQPALLAELRTLADEMVR